jgi:NADPH:quinone reductase-like Zn-dependent oxidoreductase
MKGIIVKKVGATFHFVEHLEKPQPGKNQILVKSIVTAINPVSVSSPYSLQYVNAIHAKF